jgi:hypothetical protein
MSAKGQAMSDVKTIELELGKIRLDETTQPRVLIDYEVCEEYAAAMRDGDINKKFPPVEVFFDGCDYWLADGYHRYHASKSNEASTIEANVRQGSKRDAILFSAGANASHGLRRTNADKRKAVLMLLRDEQWAQWSDHEIARRCGVNRSTVTRQRSSLAQSASEKSKVASKTRTYKTKHGSVSRMRTKKIGLKPNRTPGTSVDLPEGFDSLIDYRKAIEFVRLNIPRVIRTFAKIVVAAKGEEFAVELVKGIENYLEELKELEEKENL